MIEDARTKSEFMNSLPMRWRQLGDYMLDKATPTAADGDIVWEYAKRAAACFVIAERLARHDP